MDNRIISYPDLQTCIQIAKATGKDHFKLAWSQAHEMDYDEVTEQQREECQYLYYVVLSQAVYRPPTWGV